MLKIRGGKVFMKNLPVIFVAILLATAGLGSVDSTVVAAGGGYANKCGGGKIFLHAKEKRLLTLHNNARRNHGLRPFCVSSALQKAARAHSKDMIQRDYFSHYTKGKNEDACTRIRRFGYRWSHCGENIGYNTTPDRMFHSWMRSSGHRRNILDGKFRNIGIGAYTGYYFRSKTTMYTVDFGTRL
jgi:uncharacterized protein YkwD